MPLTQLVPLIFWSIMVFAVVVIAYVVYTEIKLQGALPPGPGAARRSSKPGYPRSTQPRGQEGQLYQKLLGMLRGDEGVARRLLRSVALKNPGRSMQWCYEKVIFDLERDRRAY